MTVMNGMRTSEKRSGHRYNDVKKSRGGGRDLGPFWTGCLNTIVKEMGPFSASSEWHEWTNFHSKWVSYWPGHSIWVPFAFISHSG